MVGARSRRLAVASLGALAIALALTPAAGARTLTCELSASGRFDPPLPPLGSISSGFTFRSGGGLSGATRCSLDSGPMVPSTIGSTGHTSVALCGRMYLVDESDHGNTWIDVGSDGTVEAYPRYSTDTYGWQGILRVSTVNGLPEDTPRPHGNFRVDEDGVLTLRPQHPCTFAPLTRFTLEGAFTVAW